MAPQGRESGRRLVNLIYAGLSRPEGDHRKTMFRREQPRSEYARSGRGRERQHDVEGSPYRGAPAFSHHLFSSSPLSREIRVLRDRRRRRDGRGHRGTDLLTDSPQEAEQLAGHCHHRLLFELAPGQ
jgi:hypothetical protein